MGQFDNPQQQRGQYNGNDGQQQVGNRMLQDTSFANRNGSDQNRQAEQKVQQDLNSVVSHLKNAESLVEQRGPNAGTQEYNAAIRAADSIDQQAVSRERQRVEQLLQGGNLDAQTKRALIQEDCDLHTLQRAPGFARANFALLNIRGGNQYFGTQLLLEAEQADPEMMKDPNFQRHLKLALDAGSASMRAAAGQQPTDSNGYPIQQPGQQPGQPGQPGDASQVPGRVTDNTGGQQAAGGMSPVQQVEKLYSMVTGPQSMTPQMQQAFKSAIQQADSAPSPLLQALTAQAQTLQQALAPLGTAQMQQTMGQVDNAVQAEVSTLPAASQQQAAALYNKLNQCDDISQRTAIEQRLIALDPKLQTILTQADTAMGGTAMIQKLCQFNAVKEQLAAEQNQAAITRFTFGMALAKAGDPSNAQLMIKDAIGKNTDQSLTQYWQQIMTQLGQTQPGQVAQPGQAAQPGQVAQPGQIAQPGQANGTSAAQILNNAETQFNSAQQQHANMSQVLNQLGPQFMAAIQKADQEFQQVAPLAARDQQAQTQLGQMFNPQQQAQIKALGQQLDAALPKLSPQDQQLYMQYQNPATTDAQRQQIHDALAKDSPAFAQVLDQFNAAVGPSAMHAMMQIAADQAQIQSAVEGRFLTRYYLADAANRAGDARTATTELTNAFESVPPPYQKAFAQKPEVQQLATTLHMDLTK